MHVPAFISLFNRHVTPVYMRVCVCVCVCVCACMCVRVCVRLGGHAIDQAPQLFDHSLYQLLFVSVILPELREDVVLLTGVLHPGRRETRTVTEMSHCNDCILSVMYWLACCH